MCSRNSSAIVEPLCPSIILRNHRVHLCHIHVTTCYLRTECTVASNVVVSVSQVSHVTRIFRLLRMDREIV
jgi:hypothetical protein